MAAEGLSASATEEEAEGLSFINFCFDFDEELEDDDDETGFQKLLCLCSFSEELDGLIKETDWEERERDAGRSTADGDALRNKLNIEEDFGEGGGFVEFFFVLSLGEGEELSTN